MSNKEWWTLETGRRWPAPERRGSLRLLVVAVLLWGLTIVGVVGMVAGW